MKKNILHPDIGKISLSESDTFTYAFKDDVQVVVDALSINEEQKKIFEHLYQTVYLPALYELVYDFFSKSGKVALHIYSAQEIKETLLGKLKNAIQPCITMDPSRKKEKQTNFLPTSRVYKAKGSVLSGRYIDLASVKHLSGEQNILLADDDSFSGSTLTEVKGILKNQLEIGVGGYMAGINVQAPNDGLSMTSAVQYIFPSHFSQKEKENAFDMGDPRDFLLGASGLMVGENLQTIQGRVPYILPYVSPNIRMGIPKEYEADFSKQVLKLNTVFYEKLSQLGCNMNLSQLHPDVKKYYSGFGYSNGTSVQDLIDISIICLNVSLNRMPK